ncbi:hypothetical protein Plhal304r1_c029g0094171 [Plasmopara halstedii]
MGTTIAFESILLSFEPMRALVSQCQTPMSISNVASNLCEHLFAFHCEASLDKSTLSMHSCSLGNA